jgi:hypothetical protein
MKKVIIASSIAALGVTGLAGGAVFATANSTSGTDPMSGLVSAIATKFNLKKDNVQKVFDEQRTQMETQREQEVKDQVAQLVKDGKLTQAQADKINAKRAELVKEREANRTSEQNLTDAQRKTKMEERKTTLDTWLKDNSIDSQYAYLLMGGRGGRGGPDGGKRDSRSSSSQSSTSSTSSNN